MSAPPGATSADSWRTPKPAGPPSAPSRSAPDPWETGVAFVRRDPLSPGTLGRPPEVASPTGLLTAGARSGFARHPLRSRPSPTGRPPRVAALPKPQDPVEHTLDSPNPSIYFPNHLVSLYLGSLNSCEPIIVHRRERGSKELPVGCLNSDPRQDDQGQSAL